MKQDSENIKLIRFVILTICLQTIEQKLLYKWQLVREKTFTAITAAYRLLKYGKMNRILFLVDTKSLGEQAERKYTKMIPVLFLSFMECVG